MKKINEMKKTQSNVRFYAIFNIFLILLFYGIYNLYVLLYYKQHRLTKDQYLQLYINIIFALFLNNYLIYINN